MNAPHMPTPEELTALRLRLRENSYHPVPVIGPHINTNSAGKRPTMTGWKTECLNATPEKIAGWSRSQLDCTNTGLLCGEIVGVDIDVLDDALSSDLVARAFELFGPSPLRRIGRAPKTLLLYRVPEPHKKLTTPDLIFSDDISNREAKAKVEILADGQQFVAFGIHPDTGAPYRWPERSPLDTAVSNIPIVSLHALEEFVAEAEAKLRAAGARTAREIKNEKIDQNSRRKACDREGRILAALRDGDKPSREVISEALDHIPNNMDYDEWIRIGFALYDGLGDSGCDLWESWSAKSQKNDPHFTARKWPGFASGNQITLGTLFWYAAQNGWRRRSVTRRTTTNRASSPRPEQPALINDIVTEDSAAVEFVELHRNDLRYCHSTGAWFRWNSVTWEKDETGIAFQWAREHARKRAEELDEKKRYITSKTSFASGVERFAKVDPVVAVTIGYWDSDPMLLGTPGGTLDLQSGELRPSRLDDGITKLLSVAPTDDPCPRWLRFLAEATGEDGELIRFLQQWCGYALTGLTREHALVFVYGPGGNGKSVFLNLVAYILQNYATTAAMDTFTASQSDKHPTDLAMLRGARLVTASETEEGRAWAESRIKQMTGGDPITARFMRQDFFTFTPQFKLMIVGNHKPVLKNVDEAARRRFLIVPFERKPENPDRELEEKLKAEAPGILRWMIDGCLDWQANGLVKPPSVLAATEEYFSDQDLFAHWLADECDCEPGNTHKSETSGKLFKSWKEYALAAGNSPGSQQSFKDQMIRHGFRFYRSARAREFFGVMLRQKASFYEVE